MDEEYEDSGGTRWRVVILILCALLAAAAIVLAYFLFWRKPPAEETPARLDYAEGVISGSGVTAVDETALQSAADNIFLLEESPGVSLEYKNNPKSSDGKNFTCHIANAADNLYDMYIAVYADSGCTDELFRSGRLPPGTPIEQLTLARALEPGVHPCTVAFIQVEDGTETVLSQTLITMDFTVS